MATARDNICTVQVTEAKEGENELERLFGDMLQGTQRTHPSSKGDKNSLFSHSIQKILFNGLLEVRK